VLAAAILGPAHVQVDATVGDLPSGDPAAPFPGPDNSGRLQLRSRFINQPVRNLFPVIIVGVVHRARKLGFELVSKSRNVAAVRLTRLT